MSTLSWPFPKIRSTFEAARFNLSALVVRLLSGRDPDMARLMAAPFDDEPFTLEQRAKVAAALEQVRRGEVIPLEEAFPPDPE